MSVVFDEVKNDEFFTYQGTLYSKVPEMNYNNSVINALNVEDDYYYNFEGDERVEKV